MHALLSTNLPGIPLFKRGKVRDVYSIGDDLLIIATDRISAFDVVMPNGIPDKGKILTALSNFWFNFTKNIISNHLINTDFDSISSGEKKLTLRQDSGLIPSVVEGLQKYKNQLDGRTILVKRTTPLKIECVVRGYLSGSAWKEYKQTGIVSGIKLPKGLKESDKLTNPIFTPATKAETGHDENITPKEAASLVGDDIFDFVSRKSVEIYKKASDYALKKGIIIADTKFEFGKIDTVIATPNEVRGKQSHNEIILIDEILTPDSSRFWPKDKYVTGRPQPSFDKQFVRDYLETLNWDKAPPAPELPEDVIKKTQKKYYQALKMLTGE